MRSSFICSRVDHSTVIVLLALAVATVAGSFMWQGMTGLSIQDEGWLWYGTQRVMHGEVPQVDFIAYEPGRYYWAAAIMSLLRDDGIVALRIAFAVIEAIAILGALLLLASMQEEREWSTLILWLVVVVLWMYPRHKLFDVAASISLVCALAWCLRAPGPVRYFFLGAVVAAATIAGRNHGLYGGVASIITVAFLAIRGAEMRWVRAFALLAAGFAFVAGCALVYASTVPGWLAAIRESFLFVFEQGTTNFWLPVPWPWRVHIGEHFEFETLRQLLIGMLAIALIAVPLAGYYRAIHQPVQEIRVNAVGLAATFLALPYAHHAFSRADLAHFAQGIFPMMILLVAMSHRGTYSFRLLTMSALAVVTAIVMLPVQPGMRAWLSEPWRPVVIGSDTLLVQPGLDSEIALLRTLADRLAPEGQAILVTPLWPGAYPILGRHAPVWEIYAPWPRSDAFQLQEIERLKAARPRLIVVVDSPLDGREELRFSNTHPLFLGYIKDNFVMIEGLVKPDYVQVYQSMDQ
jgi:hypothetical protein